MEGTVSGGTRCIDICSRRLFDFNMRGKTTVKLCALRAEHGSAGVLLGYGAIRAGVDGCLRKVAAFTDLSLCSARG